MSIISNIIKDLDNISRATFNATALRIFNYQSVNNRVYSEFLSYLDLDINNIQTLTEIPFLPISLFKTHSVITGNAEVEKIFKSSGTGNQLGRSEHYVTDMKLYNQSLRNGFTKTYGSVEKYEFFALLPSYLEQGDSSLVYMVEQLNKLSGLNKNCFYLKDDEQLYFDLYKKNSNRIKILIGVTYALLDFVKKYELPKINNLVVMETGGMKGRREEITREEVHGLLKKSFKVDAIHSEYGMTELLSQAYSKGQGIFKTSPWMKLMVRDINDPLSVTTTGKGILNIIDLANVHSCAFIATDDLGEILGQDRFRVLGRIDNSDLRGCNLLVGS